MKLLLPDQIVVSPGATAEGIEEVINLYRLILKEFLD